MSEFLGSMLGSVSQLLGLAQGSAGGSLTALVAQLENAGLGDKVRSWVGQGENQPVTAEELAGAFKPDQIEAWAQQHGTSTSELLQVMAQALPHLVDRATPGGKVPPHEGPPAA
jgi:uncharacterized protein YidB (DUF937 family)